MHRIGINLILVAASLSMLSLPVSAQEANRFTISLKLNLNSEQDIGQTIASRRYPKDFSYTSPTPGSLGQAPGGVLIKIQPVDTLTFAYRVWVDSDGNGSLDNDTPQVVAPNSSITIRVNRRLSDGRRLQLPYTINYSREPDQKGQLREVFSWRPQYRAEGNLKIRSCTALFVLLDLNSDGQFDAVDSDRGTNIGLDRDGDGRIWGTDEYLKGQQIIEYCGESFLINSFAIDGTAITLTKTDLQVPKLGSQLPTFSLTTLEGTKLESKDLRNKVHLLDFWASWCKPCVEKFSLVKNLADEFKDSVSIIAINVDEADRIPLGQQIIKDYRLPWPHVMSGRGEADPLWKMFGAMGGNHLTIPLYVLVDSEGRLRYASNGGEGLLDLRNEIKQLLSH